MATPKKKASPTLDSPKKRKPDVLIPDSLAALNVTTKSLSKGSYQKKLLAFFAPHLMPEMLNALRRNAEAGDNQSLKLIAEIYAITQKGGGVNVLVNQNNANVNERSNRRDDGPISFEQIASILEEEEQKRAAIPAAFQSMHPPMYIEATPDAAESE